MDNDPRFTDTITEIQLWSIRDKNNLVVRYESELGRKHLHLKSLQSKWPLETYDL